MWFCYIYFGVALMAVLSLVIGLAIDLIKFSRWHKEEKKFDDRFYEL